MTSDLDIYRTANVLIREQCDEAALEATQQKSESTLPGNDSVDVQRIATLRRQGSLEVRQARA
jgi:hypothetical protein